MKILRTGKTEILVACYVALTNGIDGRKPVFYSSLRKWPFLISNMNSEKKCKCKLMSSTGSARAITRSSQRLMIKCLKIPDRIGIWKCWLWSQVIQFSTFCIDKFTAIPVLISIIKWENFLAQTSSQKNRQKIVKRTALESEVYSWLFCACNKKSSVFVTD